MLLAGLVTASCGFIDDREATTAQGPTTSARGPTTSTSTDDSDDRVDVDDPTGGRFDLSTTSGLPEGWRATTGPTFPLPEDGEGLQPAPGDGPVPDPVAGLCPTLAPLNDMISAITSGNDPAVAKLRVAELAGSLAGGPSTDAASVAMISDVRAFLAEADAAMTDLTDSDRLRAQFMDVVISNAPLVVEYIDGVIGCDGAPVTQMREIQSGLGVQQQLPRSGSPAGRVDTLAVTDGRLDVWGWATDPDALGPVTIQIAINGEIVDSTTTREVGPFGDLTLPGFVQGFFSSSRQLGPGPHRICVRVVNVGPGDDSLLGCRSTA